MSFWNPEPEIRLVEITDPVLPMVEDEESIRTLASHPGFLALNNRMRMTKAVLETELRRTKHKDIRDVDRLQSGIFWCEWLQSEVNRAVGKKREVEAVSPSPSDTEKYQQAFSLIQGV